MLLSTVRALPDGPGRIALLVTSLICWMAAGADPLPAEAAHTGFAVGELPSGAAPVQSFAAPDSGPREVRVRTLTYAEAPARAADDGTVELELDLYRPADTTGPARPGILLMHGGGFVGGGRDLQENRQLGMALASRGYVVASIDYRLWEDRPVISDWGRDLADRVSNMGHAGVEQRKAVYGDDWTTVVGAAAEDMLRALEWARSRGPEFGLDPDRVALAGMSAGALTSVEIAYRLERFGVEVPPVSAVVAVRGAQLYVPEGTADPVSPGPPLFIVHGTEDPGIPIEAVVRLYREAREVGVPVEFHPLAGVDHDDREIGGQAMLQVRLDDGSLLVDRLLRFLDAAFDDSESLPPAVCVGSGDACPEDGRSGGSAGSGRPTAPCLAFLPGPRAGNPGAASRAPRRWVGRQGPCRRPGGSIG